jgi:hypothetical protein
MGWLGDARSTAPSVLVTMTQRKCIEAVFGTRLHTEVLGAGAVTLDPPAALYPYGTSVRVQARPNAGHYFSHWTNVLSSTANPANYRVIHSNALVSAVFLPLPTNEFALTVEIRGRGKVQGQGQSSLLNSYPVGSNVLVRAIPDSGQDFLGWVFHPPATNSPTRLTNTVLMDTNRNLVAQFTDRPWIEIVRCRGELLQGIFRMKVHGRLGETYAIDSSPHLNDPKPYLWKEVARETNELGAVQYEDPYVPGMPQRFYRARLVE